jgi:hypothetical protein
MAMPAKIHAALCSSSSAVKDMNLFVSEFTQVRPCFELIERLQMGSCTWVCIPFLGDML